MTSSHTPQAVRHPAPGALQAALGIEGLPCAVEAFDRLAVVRFESMDAVSAKPARQRIVALAREHGFTHVAVELDSPSGAPVPGDQS